MNWLLIIVVLLVVFLLIKLSHLKHKIILIVLFIVFLSIYATFGFVVKKTSIDLTSPAGIVEASKAYFIWIGNSVTNIKSITGNVISMEWLPDKDPNTDSENIDRQVMKG